MVGKEIMLSQETVYNGIIVNVRRDKARIQDGTVRNREVVEHPGGVAVVALDENDCVILVRQYRYPMGEEVLEIPAGKLEPGEDPRQAALRELSEETGLIPGEFVELGISYSSPGIFTEKIHLYLARQLTQGEAHPDPGEFVEPVRIPFDRLLEMAATGELRDGKTLAGLLKTVLIQKKEGRSL